MLAIGAIYLSMLASSLQAATFNSPGCRVTPTQFTDIYQLVQQLRERFHAPPTRVFVLRRQSFLAQALGIRAPYTIVLPHALIDALELEELEYELGKALGHICFGHTRMALLLGGEGLLLSLSPGKGDVIASTKDGKFVAEHKGGIVNTTHARGYTWPPTPRLSCWAARYAARPGIAA